MSLLAIFYCKKEDFCQKFNKWMVFQKLKGKFSLTQANFLKTQAKFSQLKLKPQLNKPEILVTSIAAKTAKKKACINGL